jgi:hypothetical protein
LGIPLVLFPGASLVLALPLAWVVWSEEPSLDMDPILLAYAAIVAAAVLAIPGYFVAAFEEQRLASMNNPGRWWIRSSLAAGIVAALVGIPLTFFFSRWLWVFPAGTIVGCSLLLMRAEQLWRSRVGRRDGSKT